MDKRKTLGVIIGRFQTPDLHAGHKYLIDTVDKVSDKLMILIGSSGGQPTERNPLDYKARETMLQYKYPNAIIRELFDQSSTYVWSDTVDATINKEFSDYEVTLYGSRDSFIPDYHGKFSTKEIEPIKSKSATQIRNGEDLEKYKSIEFRKGVIHAHSNQRYPISYQAVDVAVINKEKSQILLGKKENEEMWRFIGGHVDATDESLESSAKRELSEEAGDIEVGALEYVGSCRVEDHRYRGSKDSIMTALFIAEYISGTPRGADDIVDVKWFDIKDLDDNLMPVHKPVVSILSGYLK